MEIIEVGRYIRMSVYSDPVFMIVFFKLMLAFLDALVCFGCLTSSALLYFITALCRTLNIERFCASSWETVKKMLGTHLGYSALVCMTRIIADR